jgi:hypothetical protein
VSFLTIETMLLKTTTWTESTTLPSGGQCRCYHNKIHQINSGSLSLYPLKKTAAFISIGRTNPFTRVATEKGSKQQTKAHTHECQQPEILQPYDSTTLQVSSSDNKYRISGMMRGPQESAHRGPTRQIALTVDTNIENLIYINNPTGDPVMLTIGHHQNLSKMFRDYVHHSVASRNHIHVD